MTDYTREILCDIRKKAVEGALGYINDPDSMTEEQQKEMWLKAFTFQIEVNFGTERNPNIGYKHAQAAMIRSAKIRVSGVHQGSRYEVYPATAKHNMEHRSGEGMPVDEGIKLRSVNLRQSQNVHFDDLGVEAAPAGRGEIVCLPGGSGPLELPLGIDFSLGKPIKYVENDFTLKDVSFSVARHDFPLEKGQKIGMVVWRSGRIYEYDNEGPSYEDGIDGIAARRTAAADRESKLSEEDEKKFYGPPEMPMTLTGEVTAVYEGGKVFRHDINTLPGCSGAAIFLLDKHQKESVFEQDYGCVIGFHSGGQSVTKFNVGMAMYADFFRMSRPEDYAAVNDI